jgi:predicted nucleic acid-binding protein
VAELIRPRSGLVVAAPVVAELAMGARSDRREQDLRDLLALFPRLRFRHELDAGAAIYRECRRSGVTPGGLLDCAIAAIALRHDALLLTSDIGQARIGQVMPLRLDPASIQP